LSRLEKVAKSGAIISSIGIALFVAFVVTLLLFPVTKECNRGEKKCSFSIVAPQQLKPIVQPSFLALALAIIATGILMIRFSSWYDSKNSKRR
jgi:hypothetical protein